MKEATILIPDISGYTQFLTRTELSHSTHIVNELLQVIADTIQPDFQLVEVEGDALLTYADGYFSPSRLEELCEKAFRNFHYYLKVIERDRVCKCGACQGASDLSLKFIVHYGQFEEIKIAHLKKLSGPDMIIAHRLMKNNISSDEYILMADTYYDQEQSLKFVYEPGHHNYPIIGDVFFHFADITFLKEKVASPEKLEDLTQIFGLAREVTLEIEAPLNEVHRVLTEQSEKMNYVEGLVSLTTDDQINRVGSSHICEFDGDSFDIKTLQDAEGKDQVIYIEQATSMNFGFSLLIFFELNQIQPSVTQLTFRIMTADRQPLPEEMADQIYAQNEYAMNLMKSYVEKL